MASNTQNLKENWLHKVLPKFLRLPEVPRNPDGSIDTTKTADYNREYGKVVLRRYIVYLVVAIFLYLIYHACLSCTLSRCLDSQDTLYIKSLKDEIIRDYLKKKYSSLDFAEIELITARILSANNNDEIRKIRFETADDKLKPDDIQKIITDSLFNEKYIGILKTLLSKNYMIANDSLLTLTTEAILKSKGNENELKNIIFKVYLNSIDPDDLKSFFDKESKNEKEKLTEYFKNKYNLSVTELINLVEKISIMTNNLKDVRYYVNFFDLIRFNNKYLEIIFWSLFGVITFLIYTAAENLRFNTFDPYEHSSYPARMWYTPFITIVVLLLLNRVMAAVGIDNTKTVSFGFDNAELLFLIAFSFVSGFYTKRTVELLNRIKDAILPEGKSDEINYYRITGEITHPVPNNLPFDASIIKVILKNMITPSQPNFVNAQLVGNKIVYLLEKIEKGTYELSAEYVNGTDIWKSERNYKIDLISGNPVYTQNIEMK